MRDAAAMVISRPVDILMSRLRRSYQCSETLFMIMSNKSNAPINLIGAKVMLTNSN